MPNFLFAYHGGKRPETPEEGAAEMQKWRNWFEEMGLVVVQPGNPVGMSKTVSAGNVADDGGSNPVSGFSVVSANTMDDAIGLAKNCPICGSGGSVEVAEVMEM